MQAVPVALLDRRIAWVVAVLLGGLTLFIALWKHGVFGTVPPFWSDFVSFHAAGRLVLAGTPELAYDRAAHWAMEQAIRGDVAPQQFFFYPPTFLPIAAVLATMPYFVAFAVYQVGTFAVFWLVWRAIAGSGTLGAVLAFPPFWWCVGEGQNTFLVAALLGVFTLAIDRRPGWAGAAIGALCFKPHFGLLAPVALLAGRRWVAFAAAAGSVAVMAAVTTAICGTGIWGAYLRAFAASGDVYASGRIDNAGGVSIYAAGLLLGLSAPAAYGVQAVFGAVAALAVAEAWWRDRSLAYRASVFLVGTMLTAPLILVYDQFFLLMAMAWIGRTGLSRHEAMCFGAIYLLSVLTWPVGRGYGVPLGPVASLIVLAIVLRRRRSP